MLLRQPSGVGKAIRIRRRYIMTETCAKKKEYFHYPHTDACTFSRWTSRESYEFMYARPWDKIVDFYSNVVKGQTSLHKLFGAETHHVPEDTDLIEACGESEMASIQSQSRKGKWARNTFKIVLSYHGGTFDGWQKQPGLNTVQGLVEESLGEFIDDKKAERLKEKGLPKEGCAVVAGRTDKGVTGFQQVCSFYTWREDIKVQDIEDAINSASPGNLRVISVSKVSRSFHPNFSAKWRRYLYIFPFNNGEDSEECSHNEDTEVIGCNQNGNEQPNKYMEFIGEESLDDPLDSDKDEMGSKSKPTRFTVSKVNQLLRQLEGKLLSYKIFARDTKPSRNVGPPTECFLYHARATEIILPCNAEDGKCTKAMCIELVANRFLRKMVRVLVATSIREAAAGAEDDALIKLMDATCRRATAPPAPPDGLCLFDVGYKDFDPQTCLII